LRQEKWYYAYGLANVAAGGSSILLPLYAIHLGADAGEVGLLAAAASLVSVPASIGWGYLSDRWKARKYFVVLGFLGMTVSFFLMAFVDSLYWLVLINGFFSLWWIASASLATVMIVETENRSNWEKRIAFFNYIVGFGWLAGLIGGFGWTGFFNLHLSQDLSFQYLFLLFSFVSLVAFITSLFWIPEKVKFKKRTLKNALLIRGSLVTERFRFLPSRIYFTLSPNKIITTLKRTSKRLNYFLVAVLCTFMGFSIFFVPLPVWLKESVGFSVNEIFLLFIANSFASAAFNNKAGELINTLGVKRSVATSLFARIFLFPIVLVPLLLRNPVLITGGIAVILFLVGITWTTINIGNSLILASITSSGLKGQIFGIYNGIIGVSGILGALLGGYIAKLLGYLSAFLCASLLVLIGTGFFHLYSKLEAENKPENSTFG